MSMIFLTNILVFHFLFVINLTKSFVIVDVIRMLN